MTINERIKEIRSKLKVSQLEFGKPLGMSFATISGYERGRIPEMGIKAICHYYNVREEWILTGDGEMFEPSDDENEIKSLAKKYNLDEECVSILRRYVALTDEERKLFSEILHKLAGDDGKNTTEREQQ